LDLIELQAAKKGQERCKKEPAGFHLPNVELIRVKDGATGAPHQACLTPTSDPSIG
jgi:hypothetical protein